MENDREHKTVREILVNSIDPVYQYIQYINCQNKIVTEQDLQI